MTDWIVALALGAFAGAGFVLIITPKSTVPDLTAPTKGFAVKLHNKLAVRDLLVPAELISEVMTLLASRGLTGRDAETCLDYLLVRLAADLGPRRIFTLPGLAHCIREAMGPSGSNSLFAVFGSDAGRAALMILADDQRKNDG